MIDVYQMFMFTWSDQWCTTIDQCFDSDRHPHRITRYTSSSVFPHLLLSFKKYPPVSCHTCCLTSIPVLTDVTFLGHLLIQRSLHTMTERRWHTPPPKQMFLPGRVFINPLTDTIRQYWKNSKKPCLFTLPSYTSGTCVLQTRYLSKYYCSQPTDCMD